MVNDIAAGNLDSKMMEVVGKLGVPYIAMHMQGTPQNMQKNPQYDDVLVDVRTFFAEKITQAHQLGIHDIILDPGFGFGKRAAHNFTLLNHLDSLLIDGTPLLVGVSRKSMIYKTLGITANEALNGTTALNSIAVHKGAHILRVHDVKPAMEVIRLLSAG
jgi:dihydropteroate synthase